MRSRRWWYEGFDPVVALLAQAAVDPDVLAIKQTLYRSGAQSPIVEALMASRENGKLVSAVVELKARLDEENNIVWARALKQAGVHVVYGVVGLKTHAKVALVVRREKDEIRRYVHLGTGNYHTRTTRAYTDIGLLTCDKDIGEEVHRLFMQLTGLGKALKLKHLLQSPFTLHQRTLKAIQAEAKNAREGRKTRHTCSIMGQCHRTHCPDMRRMRV